MAEVLCPIDNRPCPHLTMLERQKDEPIPTDGTPSEVFEDEPYVGSGDIDVLHDFNNWQREEDPLFIEASIITGRPEMLNWDPYRFIDSVEATAQRTEVSESCASRAITECGVVVHVLGREEK